MSTPVLASEIDDAIVRYKVRVRVPSLRNGQPKMIIRQTSAGTQQELLVLQGGFARVFRWTDEQGSERAVRCFYTAPKPEYQQRYQIIDAFFRKHIPNITAQFRYHEQGLTIKRQPNPDVVMPLIEMEWVEGETLLARVDRLIGQKDVAGLRRLAERWTDLIALMHRAGMAHGDLSGENVMVRQRDGSLVLIDYDGIFLPSFAGQSSDQLGNPAFQHPDFYHRPYDANMDHFSALVIYVALLALVQQPALWERYTMHDAAGKLVSDTLLFKQDDLQDLANSTIFAELARIQNPEFQRLLRALHDSARSPIVRVPNFLMLVDPQANELEQWLAQGDQGEEKALEVWLRNGFNSSDIGRAYADRMQSIQLRVERFRRVQAALAAKDDQAVVTAWDDALFARYGPAQALIGLVAQARERLARLKPLLDALQAHPPDDRQIEKLWPALETYPPAQPYAPQVREALDRLLQRRGAALQALAAALDRDDLPAIVRAADHPDLDPAALSASQRQRVQRARDLLDQERRLRDLLATEEDTAILQCWSANGFAQSSLAPPFTGQVERVRQRLDRLQQLERVLADLQNPDQDRQIFASWDEATFRGYRKAEGYRALVDAAQARLKQLEPLEAALRQRDDREVVRLWEKLKAYPAAQAYARAAGQARQNLEERHKRALETLRQALQVPPRDERAIVAAWNDPYLRQDDPEAQRLSVQVAEAQDRLAVITRLENLLRQEDQEEAALALWQQQHLGQLPIGAPFQAQIEQINQRRKALDQVAKAVREQNDILLLTAWDDTLFRGYARAQAYAPQVASARQRLANLKTLDAALIQGNDKLVLVLWDKLKVGELPGAGRYDTDVRARKQRWLTARAPRQFQGQLEEGQVRLTWSWPEGLSWVAVVARLDRFPEDTVARGSGQWIWQIHRTQYERRGQFSHEIDPQISDLYVRLFPLAPHGSEWLTNPLLAPVQLHIRALRVAHYRLEREPDGSARLEVRTGAGDLLPILLIVLSPSGPAAHPGAGTPIGRVESVHRSPDGIYQVPLRLTGWRPPYYLTLFPANQDDARWLRLIPEGGQAIQVT